MCTALWSPFVFLFFCMTCNITSSIGFQSSPELLMYTIPFLETVAGEALSILCGSNTILQLGAIGIRSPLASVNVLLSSSTELRFSIQIASTGPSKINQTWSAKMSNICHIIHYIYKAEYFMHTNLINFSV